MSNTKPAENWERFRNLDIGELNEINRSIFESRYSESQNFATTLASVFGKHYSYDIVDGTGPYAAVVLEVLSGPQLQNEAATRGGQKTKTVNIKSHPNPLTETKEKANERPPIKVIAKIPEFDVDIDWPKDKEDRARIDAHAEFHQMHFPDAELEKITVGSVIYVQYSNTENLTGFNGRPAGKIIGVHSIGAASEILTKLSPRKSLSPDCKTARNVGLAGGLFIGHTEPDPNVSIGPPIRKIKGHIKTGVYGAGTAQTKAHFVEALKESTISLKHSIPGPAPGDTNAFIWAGTLKNNGYMDLLDRPLGQGRETIIYAPMTLDLTAPIEIKYYFHDMAGFGHAHIHGPNTTIEQARSNAVVPGNDFREKIGPAIKDLNRDGRNYVLVIPEMAYSRGFGNGNGGTNRINKMISGEPVLHGKKSGITIRTNSSSVIRPAMKNYLSSLKIEATKNLLNITPIREREFATFDGSFTGGRFGDFHREVLEVLDEHLGTISDKVMHEDGLISFVADGLGALALASIVKKIPNSETHSKATTSFKSALVGRRVRIDYITDELLDSPGPYDYFFGQGTSPSTILWRDFLQERTDDKYTEFNYIMSPTTKEWSSFFNNVGKIEQYKTHSKSASGLGQRKFSFFAKEGFSGESFISMHVSPPDSGTKRTRAGYAFSMVNDFLASFRKYPMKPDANTKLKPSFDGVPDHAYALSTKPSLSDREKILKKRATLEPAIKDFEILIKELVKGSDDVCNIERYSVYCKDGEFKLDTSSLFFKSYIDYLEKKKDYMETFLLDSFERDIQAIISNRDELIKLKNQVDKLLKSSKVDIKKTNAAGVSWQSMWDNYKKEFKISNFQNTAEIFGEAPNSGTLAVNAGLISAQHAYVKIKKKIEYAINRIKPEEIKKPKECEPQPTRRADLVEAPPTPTKTPPAPDAVCLDPLPATPATFQELQTMIKYYPQKSEFSFAGRSSKTKTKIHLIEGYKTVGFKYPARGANGQITTKESPPIWACLAPKIEKAWNEASNETKYHPFEVATGIRGFQDGPPGTTAYIAGVSLHAFGVAFDVDPYITGYKKKNEALNSVFTGAWSPGFLDKHGLELWRLGVYKHSPSLLLKNAYEGENRPRMAENWKAAPSSYKGGGESQTGRKKYIKIMEKSKGSIIVPPGSDPVSWVILFCEKSGMKWGNGSFLKKRWRGGKVWSEEEKKRISTIFGIDNIVDRVKAISWNSRIEDHMHFHYWAGGSVIRWKEIKKPDEPGEL